MSVSLRTHRLFNTIQRIFSMILPVVDF